MRSTVSALVVLLCASCAVESDSQPLHPSQKRHIPAQDLDPAVDGKRDGASFDPNRLMDEHLFVDSHYLTLAQVEAFLFDTPYGHESVLASFTTEGKSAAEWIVETAHTYRINPLVFLVKLQVETSLIYASESSVLLDKAMGCGCLDYVACIRSNAGFVRQLDCAGSLFREYLDDLANEGETRSEWAVGREKETLDGTLVVPSNRATAALYTYTPWVLVGSGGNWLFWNVFQNYSRHLLKAFPNHRWIGGECVEHSDCGYDDGICMEGSEETSFCTMSCDRVCPDSAASHTAATFCADLGTAMDGTPAGWCLSRCDEGLFPETGCATGYHCVDTARFGESDVVRAVCWPGENPRHDSGIE